MGWDENAGEADCQTVMPIMSWRGVKAELKPLSWGIGDPPSVPYLDYAGDPLSRVSLLQ
jgi:hypothetical protein